MKIPQIFIIVGGSITIILLALLSVETWRDISLADDSINNPRTITVMGEGEVKAVADTATFSFGIQAMADSSAQATDQLAQRTAGVLDYLAQADVPDSDIKTQSLEVSPQYRYQDNQEPTITGYEARQSVEVKVTGDNDAGQLIAGLTERGVDNISNISFTIDDDEELKREARAQAIADATEEAKLLASDLSVKLGEVISFSENSGPQGPQPYYAREFMASDESEDSVTAPQLPSGENTFISEVQVTYRIY